jgi:hypothetical protein
MSDADDTQQKNRNMSILQTCPPDSTAGQQSGGSAAAVDGKNLNPAQKYTASLKQYQ